VQLLNRIAEAPSHTALFFDVDGVLAPIVERAEDAVAPEEIRRELRRLQRHYVLVACISGRAGDDARRIVGIPELTYVGNHGLELAPDAAEGARRLQAFLAEVQWDGLENKELSAALHYRDAEDEAAARAQLGMIAQRARAAGLRTRYGRKVLEVLPALDADKGTAVRRLLEQQSLHRALYAGDDTTDIDAFAALDGLTLAVRVAVASAEGPQELRAAADVVLDSQDAVLPLLRRL
jgi:trehalose 6-phosphate phosphatase